MTAHLRPSRTIFLHERIGQLARILARAVIRARSWKDLAEDEPPSVSVREPLKRS